MAAGRLAEMERAAINAAVASAQGNLSMAARNLGISRSTLYVKLAAMRNVPSEGSLSPQ
jgi:transcriptional regulator of acetoin/glycerol metabolism